MLKDLTKDALEKLQPAAGKDMKVKKVTGQVKRTLLSDGTLNEGGLIKCPGGKHFVTVKQLHERAGVCPVCNHYFHLSPAQRIEAVSDPDTFIEWDAHLSTGDPLRFPNYQVSIEKASKKSGSNEAVTTGIARIEGIETVIAVMDTGFLLGTMGTVVGEKITRAIEEAARKSLPIIIFTASGGARMQEGIYSLMQMAKTSAAMELHGAKGLLSIIVLTDPTFGGVTASFAMLGDITLAECGARIGFAGPRVIQQTINQDLPEGFQDADFILEHGFCDRTVTRAGMKPLLATLLRVHGEGETNER